MNDTTDVSLHVGLWKGIAGTVSPGSNSNFVEAVLFLLSVSTDILCDTDQESSYPTLKSYLMEHITLPLRSGRFIDVDVMKKWRQDLNEISTGQLLPVSSGREMQKFLTLLLQHICNLHPLHEFNNLKADYTMTLFAHKDARVGFPTVQKLLEKTCIQEKVKFNKVPDNLILILPRWSLGEEKIFPNLHIDLTDVLEYAKRVCHMCGDQAVFECPECYEQEHTDLSSAAFCQPCSQTIHKHSKRLKHMPVELKMVTQLGDEESSILILKGILCVQGSNYTTLSQPPRTSRNSLHNSTLPNWLSFNPRAATNDFTGTESVSHIPEVMLVESVPNWLSMDAYDCMAKDINTIPDNIRQLLHSCCMCVYSKS
ncbi:CYLD [Bugula neritina]|uniref:CYLD n=1 Tax=Bugula neritina TaxID=10212 RepID=A0A7J7JA24_BUGNE|nr:CYLD [Bugula neritina]